MGEENWINSGLVKTGICHRVKVHFPSCKSEGSIKMVFLCTVDLQIKLSTTTLRFILRTSFLCPWRSVTALAPLLASSTFWRDEGTRTISVDHDVPGTVNAILTSLATSSKGSLGCSTSSPESSSTTPWNVFTYVLRCLATSMSTPHERVGETSFCGVRRLSPALHRNVNAESKRGRKNITSHSVIYRQSCAPNSFIMINCWGCRHCSVWKKQALERGFLQITASLKSFRNMWSLSDCNGPILKPKAHWPGKSIHVA